MTHWNLGKLLTSCIFHVIFSTGILTWFETITLWSTKNNRSVSFLLSEEWIQTSFISKTQPCQSNGNLTVTSEVTS